MASLLGIFVALFVFVQTINGVINAVGTPDMHTFDLKAAIELIRTIYLQPFNVPEMAAGAVSYILLNLPAVLAFYTVTAIFGRKKR